MRILIVLALTSCTTVTNYYGGDGAPVAPDLGEGAAMADMAGAADLATIAIDLADGADLQTAPDDMSRPRDLLTPADLTQPYLSCVGDACGTTGCAFSQLGCTALKLCVTIGNECRSGADCCGNSSAQASCTTDSSLFTGTNGTCCSSPSGGICYKDADCCAFTGPRKCLGVSTTDAGFVNNGNCQ